MSTPKDYYKNLWTERNAHGTLFWQKVDFNIFAYQYQEKVFREYIRNGMYGTGKIKSVLELGAGTGRMTKIMLEEFPDVVYYTIDVKHRIHPPLMGIMPMELDINDKEFDEKFGVDKNKQQFDLILASEVLLHIKPEDIENVIEKLSKVGKQIINIDWNFNPQKSEWCFIHDYDALYKKYGGKMVDRKDMKIIEQSLFHYRFS